ncbi:GNAT family N-acetyltransferase [Alteromonas sp. NFXS44]|uniref:GNAT family N-acetyltransferase n=1 Tax=Alteromonas sp. NFXS44 TaxID=2818435 RepID=UPI0032DFF7CE
MKLTLAQPDHIPALLEIAKDARIPRTSGVPENCSEQDVLKWIAAGKSIPPQEMHFVITMGSETAGCCILKKMDWHKREAELSYWLGVDFWGKGLGTKAAESMCELAFGILGMNRLVSHYLKKGSAPSGKILAKLGFTDDGDKEDLPAEGRFLIEESDVWTFVKLNRSQFISGRHPAA